MRTVKDEVGAQQTEGEKGGGAVIVDLMLAKTKAPEKLANGELLRAPATRKPGGELQGEKEAVRKEVVEERPEEKERAPATRRKSEALKKKMEGDKTC